MRRPTSLGGFMGLAGLVLAVGLLGVTGCGPVAKGMGPQGRPALDRRIVEFPADMRLEVAARNLTAATAVATGGRYVYIADQGARGDEVRIQRFDPETGELAEIYPARRAIVSWFDGSSRLRGPVGGMVYRDDELFVGLRDDEERGAVLAFDLRGWQPVDGRPPARTVVARLPAAGDHGIGELALHPISGRLYFGLGSATNSGVVGVDNWEAGWLQDHRRFHDRPLRDLKLAGYRFDTQNPGGSLLRPDTVNTSAFSPFGTSRQRIPAAPDGRPTAAIYSLDPDGGDLRVEAIGIRNPAGLAFNAFGNLWASNQGMELRGTRPVRDDPDTLLRVFPVESSDAAMNYGWPDYSADLRPITDPRLQPPRTLMARTGYEELNALIGSGEEADVPDRETLVAAVFAPLSGASGVEFVPESLDEQAAWSPFAGEALVALRGDRAPFATSGLPLKTVLGRMVVAVEITAGDGADSPGRVRPIVYNVEPGDDADGALDRPVALAFDEAGILWILDQGEMYLRGGRERFRPGTARLLRLGPIDDEN